MPHPQDSNAAVPVKGPPLPDQERELVDEIDGWSAKLVRVIGTRPTARVLRQIAANLESVA